MLTGISMGAEQCSVMYIREATIISAVRSEISNWIISQWETINPKWKEQQDLEWQIHQFEIEIKFQILQWQKFVKIW